MARLFETYKSEIIPNLTKEFGYKNVMLVPKLTKITINMGCGKALNDKKVIEEASKDLTAISGQKPIVRKAKKSIATFKLREHAPIGVSVTLRGTRMYEFMDRLVNIAMPRIRDFRGLTTKSFDGRGNYNLGLKEQVVFPEISYDQISEVRGMDINFVTTAKTDQEALALLQAFNFPYRDVESFNNKLAKQEAKAA